MRASKAHVEAVAARIRAARAAGVPVPVDDGPRAQDQATAYAVQRMLVGDRLARGERVVGWKVGYASAVIREQMGVRDPNLGPLTDAMLLADGDRLPDPGLHPRVEPEIAVVLDADVAPGTALSPADLPVRELRLALEVVDSAWADYRFAIGDNTADSSSAAFGVLGPVLPADTVWGDLLVELLLDGEVVDTGRADAAMGDPVASAAWLAGAVASAGYDRGLRAGDVILTGGLTRAMPLRPGAVACARAGGVVVAVTG